MKKKLILIYEIFPHFNQNKDTKVAFQSTCGRKENICVFVDLFFKYTVTLTTSSNNTQSSVHSLTKDCVSEIHPIQNNIVIVIGIENYIS